MQPAVVSLMVQVHDYRLPATETRPEVVRDTDLEAPRVRDRTVCEPVASRRSELAGGVERAGKVVEAPEVSKIINIEQIGRDAEVVSADVDEILAQAQIQIAVRKSVRDDERLTGLAALIEVDDKALRRPEILVERRPAGKRGESAELNAPEMRNVSDEVCDDAMTLVVRDRMPAIQSHLREREQIVPLLLSLRDVPRNACTPADVAHATAIRAVERESDAAVPGAHIVVADQHVGVGSVGVSSHAVLETAVGILARNIGHVGPFEAESVEAANVLISRGGIERPEVMPHAKAPLIGMWRLEVVGDEKDLLRRRRAIVDDVQQPLTAEIRCVPRNLTRARAEIEDVIGMLSAVLLVDRVVERQAVIVDAPAAEDARHRVLIDRVREAHARLKGPVERLALRAVREIAIRIDRHEALARVDERADRVPEGRRRDVIPIVHVRLVIPSDAEIQGQALRRAPVILHVQTNLGVVARHRRIADPDSRRDRSAEVVARIEREDRVLVELLVQIVVVEIDVEAELRNVGAGGMARVKRVVIADRKTLLLQVLSRRLSTDGPDAVIDLPRSVEIERVRGPVIPLIAEQGFVRAERAVV